jgi:cell division transport system permease protein
MCFLACLALGAVLTVNKAAHNWLTQATGAVTVQITDTENLTSGDQLQAVERVLKRTRGIASYEIIPEEKLIGLLEPWLGTGNVTADLPIPVMIDVILNPEQRFNEKGLRIELSAVAPGAKLDTHGRWRQNLERGVQTM